MINSEYSVKLSQNFEEKYKSFYPYDTETGKKFFETITNSNNRFNNHEFFMTWFPEYYFLYKQTLDTILENKEGFLPLSWKIFLGIMAASTIRNEFLLRNLQSEFLIVGGEEDWLIYGLSAVPEKLKKLEILNNILAHQPWKIEMQNINDIICNINNKTSINSTNNANKWNIEDLVQSVIVLTTFQRLATVLECMKYTIKKTEEETIVKDANFDKKIDIEENEEGVKNKILNELEIMNNSDDLPVIKFEKNTDESSTINVKCYSHNEINENGIDFSKYISKFCTVYLDFDIHSEEFFSLWVNKNNKIIIFSILNENASL